MISDETIQEFKEAAERRALKEWTEEREEWLGKAKKREMRDMIRSLDYEIETLRRRIKELEG